MHIKVLPVSSFLLFPICSGSVLRENGVQTDEIGHEAMIIWWPRSNSWKFKHDFLENQESLV